MAVERNTTRRALFGAAAILPAAFARPALATLVNPDAELVALGRQWPALMDAWDAASDAADVAYGRAGASELQAAERGAGQAVDAVFDRIVALPATTLEGLRVKAMVAARYAAPRPADNLGDMGEYALWSLLDDLTEGRPL